MASIVVTNLVLPLFMGRETYGTYVVIVGASFLAQALISSPADTTFLLQAYEPGSSVAGPGYMPAKALLTSAVAGCASVAAGLPLAAVLAAVLLAGGQAAVTGVLHHSYRAGAGRTALGTGLLMAIPGAVVPLLLGPSLGATPVAAISGALSCLLGIVRQRGSSERWSFRQLPLGFRQVIRALGRQAWPSYMNSAVPWLAILRLGASRPASTAVLKLAFSLMNAGQSLVPITSSIVLAATMADNAARRRTTVRILWFVVCIFGVMVGIGIRLFAPVIDRIYGGEYPALIDYLPLAAAGVTACTVYWVFWPVTIAGKGTDLIGFVLGAVTFSTAAVMMIVGTSVQRCLLVYVIGIIAGALLATLRSSGRIGAAAFGLVSMLFVLTATT